MSDMLAAELWTFTATKLRNGNYLKKVDVEHSTPLKRWRLLPSAVAYEHKRSFQYSPGGYSKMDESMLDDNQRMGIRMWAQMIRSADEDRAVRMLTRIVVNLSGDKLALDAALAATKGKAMN